MWMNRVDKSKFRAGLITYEEARFTSPLPQRPSIPPSFSSPTRTGFKIYTPLAPRVCLACAEIHEIFAYIGDYVVNILKYLRNVSN